MHALQVERPLLEALIREASGLADWAETGCFQDLHQAAILRTQDLQFCLPDLRPSERLPS